MNRRRFLRAAGLAGLALTSSSCVPFAGLIDSYIEKKVDTRVQERLDELEKERDENKKEELRRHIAGIRQNIVTLHSSFDYMIESKEEGPIIALKKISGEGVIVGNYVITCDHIVSFRDKIFEKEAARSVKTKEDYDRLVNSFEVIGEVTTLGSSTIEKIVGNSETELAVLKLPEGYEKPAYKVRMGDSDKLKLFDKVYLMGDPGDRETVIREGIIGTDGPIKFSDYGMRGIASSIVALPGDSGSPVINENGEVVGIMTYTALAYSVFEPINWFRTAIRDYENGGVLE